jgi:hypothetical protein
MKRSSVRRKAAALVAATAILAVSLSATGLAADDQSLTPTRSLTTLSSTSRALLRSTQQPPPSTPATSNAQFFKTKKGAAVLVLIGAGFGYTLYSRFHDEIKSAIREQ